MKIKLLQILSFTLLLVALAMALGVYYVATFQTIPANQVCETSCEPVAGLIPILVTLSLGALTFSVMTFLHSRDLRKREERNRNH